MTKKELLQVNDHACQGSSRERNGRKQYSRGRFFGTISSMMLVRVGKTESI